jgi:CheY-like chemotaxis protein
MEENGTKRNLNIMVVDDNQDAANSLALYLKAIGYETMVAHDGNTAIELAARDQPAVIFLDIGMPGINGYEVAEYIRKQSWGKAIKLIAVTGWGQDEDRRKSTLAGFDDHLVKPVDPTLIHQIIKHLET